MRSILSTIATLLAGAAIAAAPEKIIFDTDIGTDFDDDGALAVLHSLADLGEAELLGVAVCNRAQNTVAMVEIINTYYGRPGLPVSCVGSNGVTEGQNRVKWYDEVTGKIVSSHRADVRHSSPADTPLALDMYRTLLSSAPDNSVTICSVGFLTNLRDLLESEGGRELVARKVKRLVAMAGRFPSGKEYNVMIDAKASQKVFAEWPTPVVLSGWEIGIALKTGRKLAKMECPGNPVLEVFKLLLKPGSDGGHATFDQTAALVAVRGTDPYFATERGRMTVADDGSNGWTADPQGPHERLLFKMPKPELEAVIEELMCKPPKLAMPKNPKPVNIILDTDTLTDWDDVGAIAILHALADNGEANILGVLSCTPTNNSVAVVEVLNSFYGRAGIPVGCTRSDAIKMRDNGGFGLVEKYPQHVKHRNSSDAPDAVEVYKQILAAQPDKSVVVCSIGFLSNIAELLQSNGGRELFAKKVTAWYAMACSYPNGKEYNSKWDWKASKYALDTCPVPVIFSDFQYGKTVYTGRQVAELDEVDNPVKDVFARMTLPRAKVTPKTWDQMTGHSSWDETTVLAAVRGVDNELFAIERGRYAMVGEEGANVWLASPDGPHCRIKPGWSREAVGELIDGLMCRKPANRWGKVSAK